MPVVRRCALMAHAILPMMVVLAILIAVTLTVYGYAVSVGWVCVVFGHDWDLEPPWSGKELRHNPLCERCGHEPEEIVITGSHDGDHRV